MEVRVTSRDFGMGAHVPPLGGDKGPMGGDWCVIRDNFQRRLK